MLHRCLRDATAREQRQQVSSLLPRETSGSCSRGWADCMCGGVGEYSGCSTFGISYHGRRIGGCAVAAAAAGTGSQVAIVGPLAL